MYRRIAWSNTGSIACISDNGRMISFRTLVRDQQAAQYKLSEACKRGIEAPPGKEFVHLSFSGLGLDMAVVDRGGGVQVYSLGGAINRPHPAAGDFGGLAGNSDIDAVVGMHWLRVFPTEFSVGTQPLESR